MIVAFANNQTMVAIDQTASTIYTDPHPVGAANYMEVALNAEVLFTAGGGTATLSYAVEGSNDGQNWFAITAITKSVTPATQMPDTDGGDVTCAFVRFKYTLSADAGTGGTITGATFDVHANLLHK